MPTLLAKEYLESEKECQISDSENANIDSRGDNQWNHVTRQRVQKARVANPNKAVDIKSQAPIKCVIPSQIQPASVPGKILLLTQQEVQSSVFCHYWISTRN